MNVNIKDSLPPIGKIVKVKHTHGGNTWAEAWMDYVEEWYAINSVGMPEPFNEMYNYDNDEKPIIEWLDESLTTPEPMYSREQMEEAVLNAFVAGSERGTGEIPFNAEQYYLQTFGPQGAVEQQNNISND